MSKMIKNVKRLLPAWAQEMQAQLPADFIEDTMMLTYREAYALLSNCNAIPAALERNLVSNTVLKVFPDVAIAIRLKLLDGYVLIRVSYEADDQSGLESLNVRLKKGYEYFFLRQEKQELVNDFSAVIFGLEGEQGSEL